MIILENLLPPAHLKAIQNLFLSNEFPWYYSPFTSRPQSNEYGAGTVFTSNVTETPQFCHVFYYGADQKTSALFDIVSPVFVILQKELQYDFKLKRVKANMLCRQADYPKGHYNTPHVDWNPDDRVAGEKYKSFVFYVNDADGDTYLFNEHILDSPKSLTVKQTFSPKANTGIFFDSDNYHASSPPVNSNVRLVINFVFME